MEKDLKTLSEIFDGIVALYKGYSQINRRNISLNKIIFSDIDPEDVESRVDDPKILESLVEHVGTLPMVATYLYPFLENKSEIDLGKVLIMLAVHDVGETIVGDEHPYSKSEEHIQNEYNAAITLLDPMYHSLFEEYESQVTLEAKYTKAVDVFSTFLSDQILPISVTKNRLLKHGFYWEEIESKRLKLFEWDGFLKDIFYEGIKRYENMHLNK